MSNKVLFKLHGWLGLNLGLILFVICLSGTFATLSNEVDWLVNEDMRIEKSNQPIKWQAMVESLREQYPEGRNLGMYRGTYTGNAQYFATVAYMAIPNGQTLKVYLDPSTGKINGHTSFFNAQRFFRTFHRRFFDGDRGIFIITLLSIPMLIIVGSGFLFYKGWLKNLFTLRLNRKPRVKWSDAHKMAGIWSLLFALIIVLTGIFYFAELLSLTTGKNDAFLMPRPNQVDAQKMANYGETISLLPLSVYLDSAQSAYPSLDVRGIRLPHKAGDFVYINGQEGNPITRDRTNHVMLNPETAEVEHVLNSADMTLLPFITDIADPLHFGYFGGLTTKIIWFIFGLIISFSILSGTYLWFIKLFDKSKRKGKRSGRGKNTSFWLRGVTVSVFLTLCYFIWIVFATYDGIKEYGALPKPISQTILLQDVGPWAVELRAAHYFNYPDIHYLELIFEEPPGRLPNIKETSLGLIETNKSAKTHSLTVYGKTHYIEVDDAMINSIEQADSATIQMQSYNGTTHSYQMAAEPLAIGLGSVLKRTEQYVHPVQHSWPQSPRGIWLYIGLFMVLTVSAILWWLRKIVGQLRQNFKRADEHQRSFQTNP